MKSMQDIVDSTDTFSEYAKLYIAADKPRNSKYLLARCIPSGLNRPQQFAGLFPAV